MSTASKSVIVWLGIVLVVAFGVRCWQLGHDSFWIDEIQATSYAKDGNVLTEVRDRGGPMEPPLSHVATRAALALPFDFETAARVPAALAGVLEVLALFLLAREATRRDEVALLAASLLAVAPFAVRYSQEVRYVTLFSALVLLGWWLLLRALRSEGLRDWWWLGAVWGAAILTAPYAFWVVGCQAAVVLFVAWRRRERVRSATVGGLVRAAALAIAVSAPWYVWGWYTWRSDGITNYQRFAESRSRDLALGPTVFTRAGTWLLGNDGGLTLAVAALAVGVLLAPLAARGRLRFTAAAILVFLVASTLAVSIAEWQGGSYFAFRRVEWFVPLLLLNVSITVVAVADRLPRPAVWTTAAGAVLVVVSLRATLSYYDTEKTPWREMAAQLRGADPDTTVILGPFDEGWKERITRYLRWRDVVRPVQYFLVEGTSDPQLGPSDRVIWYSGAAPAPGAGLSTTGLADDDRLQIIAGEGEFGFDGEAILPLHRSAAMSVTPEQFLAQRGLVAAAPPIAPVP